MIDTFAGMNIQKNHVFLTSIVFRMISLCRGLPLGVEHAVFTFQT